MYIFFRTPELMMKLFQGSNPFLRRIFLLVPRTVAWRAWRLVKTRTVKTPSAPFRWMPACTDYGCICSLPESQPRRREKSLYLKTTLGLGCDPMKRVFTTCTRYKNEYFEISKKISWETVKWARSDSQDRKSNRPFRITSATSLVKTSPRPFWKGLIDLHRYLLSLVPTAESAYPQIEFSWFLSLSWPGTFRADGWEGKNARDTWLC